MLLSSYYKHFFSFWDMFDLVARTSCSFQIDFLPCYRLEDEKENPLPLQLEPYSLPRDVLCTFPTVGTVLRVMISRANEKLELKVLKTGRWVKLVNLKCECRAALWCAFIMPFTKICYLTDADELVLQRQRYVAWCR